MKKEETGFPLSEQKTQITIEELQEFYQKHDFTKDPSTYYEPNTADDTQNALFMRAKGHFHRVFEEKFTELCKKQLRNFSKEHPAKVLAKADEDIITDKVMKVLCDPLLYRTYIEYFFDMVEQPMEIGFKGYAGMLKKDPEDLTEEEIMYVVDKVADVFLDQMMSLLLQSQSLPEMMDVLKNNSAHEDFNPNVMENHDLIDHHRKWEHYRSKFGRMLSLDEIDPEDELLVDHEDNNLAEEALAQQMLAKFVSMLDSTDQEIVMLRMQKYSQEAIAQKLGYQSQGTVAKRMKKIREQFDAFCRSNG